MRIAVDTNILAYLAGVNDEDRQQQAEAVMLGLARHERILPVQVAAELHHVLRRKKGLSAGDASANVDGHFAFFQAEPTSASVLDHALELSARAGLRIFDAIILAAAAAARCDLLLSQDMQDGFVYRGVTVADPFRTPLHPLLADALQEIP